MRTILSIALAILFIGTISCTDKIKDRDERISIIIMDTLREAGKRLPIGKIDSIQLVSVDSITVTEWNGYLMTLAENALKDAESELERVHIDKEHYTYRSDTTVYTISHEHPGKGPDRTDEVLAMGNKEIAACKKALDSVKVLSRNNTNEFKGYMVQAKFKSAVTDNNWGTPGKYLVDKDIKIVVAANRLDNR